MSCRNPSLRKRFNLYLNPIFLCSMVTHDFLLQYFVSSVINLLRESLPLSLIWLLFFYASSVISFGFIFWPRTSFFVRKKNHHHHHKKYWLPAHRVQFLVPGPVGLDQVSLAFFFDIATTKQNQTKQNLPVSFFILEDEKRFKSMNPN